MPRSRAASRSRGIGRFRTVGDVPERLARVGPKRLISYPVDRLRKPPRRFHVGDTSDGLLGLGDTAFPFPKIVVDGANDTTFSRVYVCHWRIMTRRA
jgi:hypothetical protein